MDLELEMLLGVGETSKWISYEVKGLCNSDAKEKQLFGPNVENGISDQLLGDPKVLETV